MKKGRNLGQEDEEGGQPLFDLRVCVAGGGGAVGKRGDLAAYKHVLSCPFVLTILQGKLSL